MSGYETSFAVGEDEVEASPQFQHDANDEAAADAGTSAEKQTDAPASDDVLDAEEAGMTG